MINTEVSFYFPYEANPQAWFLFNSFRRVSKFNLKMDNLTGLFIFKFCHSNII